VLLALNIARHNPRKAHQPGDFPLSRFIAFLQKFLATTKQYRIVMSREFAVSRGSLSSRAACDPSPHVRHDQVTTFLGPLRCSACIQGSHQCLIRESDEKCVVCTVKDDACVFTRSVVKKGSKADYSWEELVGSEVKIERDLLQDSLSV